MLLGSLKNLGIDNILISAAKELKTRGLLQGATADPQTGLVSVRGAILLACGAKLANIAGFTVEPNEAKIPPYMMPKAYEAITVVEYEIGDIDLWNDHPETTLKAAVQTLTKIANTIAISII